MTAIQSEFGGAAGEIGPHPPLNLFLVEARAQKTAFHFVADINCSRLILEHMVARKSGTNRSSGIARGRLYPNSLEWAFA